MTNAKSLQGQYWNGLSLNDRQEILSHYFKTEKIAKKYVHKTYHLLPIGVRRYLTRLLKEKLQ